MSLSVVCPGCKKRFTVSDKFAGQKGPCPQCKTVIEIPKLQEDVVIHAPESAGPKDSKGTAVLRPILREETKFDPRVAGAIAGLILFTFVAAWIIGSTYKPKERGKKAELPWVLTAFTALALAPPLALAGYTFLRNDEIEPFRGKELAIRVLACGAVYAVLWGLYALLPSLIFDRKLELFELSYVVPPIVAIGVFAAYVSLELDFLTGLMHVGLYLIVTVLLRVTAGMGAF